MTKIYLPDNSFSRSDLVHASAVFTLLEGGTLEIVSDLRTADLIVEVRSPSAPPASSGSGISVGVANNSSVGPGATTYNAGDLSGGNIVIGGQQQIGGSLNVNMGGTNNRIVNSSLPDTAKDELRQLIGELTAALTNVPAEQVEAAEVVAELADETVEEVTRERPRWLKVEIKGEALKQAAANLLAVTPQVSMIAAEIVKQIAAYKAMGG